MTLGWVITGTIGQVLLAYMLFLLGVFGFSAVGNTHRPTPFDFSVLNSALYAAPASCLISAVVVIGLYRSGADEMSYLWYAAPILLFASYCLYVKLCIKRQ